jgi:hypothetical protein
LIGLSWIDSRNCATTLVDGFEFGIAVKSGFWRKNIMFAKSIASLAPAAIGSSLSILALSLTALPSNASILPKSGTVLTITNGDLMCYVELRDLKGKKHNLGATFELCEQPNKFLNRRVQLTYKRMKVNDCQSAEPCGKTRWENLVVKLKVSK